MNKVTRSHVDVSSWWLQYTFRGFYGWVFFLGEKKEKKVLQVKFVPPCEL